MKDVIISTAFKRQSRHGSIVQQCVCSVIATKVKIVNLTTAIHQDVIVGTAGKGEICHKAGIHQNIVVGATLKQQVDNGTAVSQRIVIRTAPECQIENPGGIVCQYVSPIVTLEDD